MESLDPQESLSLFALERAAREFAKLTPRKNPSAGYARALSRLVDAARCFAAKSDEAWAAEVVELNKKIDFSQAKLGAGDGY